MKNTFKFGSAYLIGIALTCGAPPVSAQQVVTCASAASDTDGDGWGWENNASCMVVAGTGEASGNCIDSDGDGYGWNGTSSCLVNTTDGSAGLSPQTVSQAAPQATNCIDSDGDGYGWDGTDTCLIGAAEEANQSAATPMPGCVDSDGDGYGWDGVQTCVVENTVTNGLPGTMSTVGTPYMNRYETYTHGEWPTISADETTGEWINHPPSTGWFFNPPVTGLPLTAVVLCEGPDISMEDPLNPGYYYDAARGQTCAKTENAPIPAPGAPVEFTDIGFEVLYENGNQWNCRSESRPSMDVEFEATGATHTVTYKSGSTAPWLWDIFFFRRHLTYKDDTLTWYNSGLSRNTCERVVVENFPFTQHGAGKAQTYRDMWNAFIGDSTPKSRLTRPDDYEFTLFDGTQGVFLPDSDLSRLKDHQILGKTMQCAKLYNTVSGRSGTFYSFGGEEVFTVESVGDSAWDITGISQFEDGWLLDGPFSVGPWPLRPDGELLGSYDMAFYSYTDNLSLLFVSWNGSVIERNGDGKSVYACETIAAASE